MANESLQETSSILGALKYNINEMLSYAFFTPTYQDILLYSDLASNVWVHKFSDILDTSGVNSFYLGADTTYSDQTIQKLISDFWLNEAEFRAYATFLPKEEYQKEFNKTDNLLGLSFFPWSPMGLPDESGERYYLKRKMSDNVYVPVNPMRREVLYIKMFTLMKILGISVGSYYALKYMLMYLWKKI